MENIVCVSSKCSYKINDEASNCCLGQRCQQAINIQCSQSYDVFFRSVKKDKKKTLFWASIVAGWQTGLFLLNLSNYLTYCKYIGLPGFFQHLTSVYQRFVICTQSARRCIRRWSLAVEMIAHYELVIMICCLSTLKVDATRDSISLFSVGRWLPRSRPIVWLCCIIKCRFDCTEAYPVTYVRMRSAKIVKYTVVGFVCV